MIMTYDLCMTVVVVVVQERDKLTVAAEGATRLRIKNQEILAKEEQVRALLASNRTKLDNLLGTRGKGIHLVISLNTCNICPVKARTHSQTQSKNMFPK